MGNHLRLSTYSWAMKSGSGVAKRHPPGRLRRLLRFTWRWGLRPVLLLAALLAALHWGGKAVHAIRSASMSETERLAEDHARLERILLREHPAPFRNGDRREVRAALDRARAAIDRLGKGELTREAVLAHFAEAVASLRDPHTYFGGRYSRFGILPILLAIFGDELRLVAAPEQADLGARVLSFDGMPSAEALERIRPLSGHANESGFLGEAPRILRSPGLLHHAGVATRPDEVTLELERADGTTATLRLPRITVEEYRARRPGSYTFDEAELPLYRRTGRGAYWFEPLPERNALYIRLENSTGFAETALEEFTERALAARPGATTSPVVVDLRGNPGGNPEAHVPLVAVLAASPDTRGPEALRVLVDRGTNSAAIVAASDLERRAGALLVGEEPGDKAHMTTDARPFTLRHSRFEIWVPTGLMHSAGGAGGRARLVPERRAGPTFAEWVGGRDPALQAALEPLPTGDADASGESAELLEPPLGRFAFDEQRTLTVRRVDDVLEADVTGLGSDILRRAPDGSWAGGVHLGLRVGPSGELERRLPLDAWAALSPRQDPAPLELALQGRTAEASAAYRRLTADGGDRPGVAALGLTNEGVYRYREGATEQGRVLFDLARTLSPAHPLIPLQHSLLRREAEGRWIPPADEFLRAVAACGRRYAAVELLNDYRLCL